MHAVFSDDRTKLRPVLEIPAVRRPNGPCYDTSAVRNNEDGSEIGRPLMNHDICDKLEANEIYIVTRWRIWEIEVIDYEYIRIHDFFLDARAKSLGIFRI